MLFDEFYVFHSPAIKLTRHGRRSGGVAVFVRKTFLRFVTLIECHYDNMICVKLSKEAISCERDLLLITLYVPPYQSPYYKQADTQCCIHNLEHYLLDLYQNGENAFLVVSGDFNARIGEWNVLSECTDDLLGESDAGDRVW